MWLVPSIEKILRVESQTFGTPRVFLDRFCNMNEWKGILQWHIKDKLIFNDDTGRRDLILVTKFSEGGSGAEFLAIFILSWFIKSVTEFQWFFSQTHSLKSDSHAILHLFFPLKAHSSFSLRLQLISCSRLHPYTHPKLNGRFSCVFQWMIESKSWVRIT